MANRRMIQKAYSVSREFNSVSEFAQLLYLMMQPHLDDFGRIDGDPIVIKALVLPMNERMFSDFETAIKELIKVGLLDRYSAGKQQVIIVPTFETDQTGLEKRTKSKYPDKTNVFSNNFKETLRISKPTEENRTESNETEPNLTKANRTTNIAVKNSHIKSIGEVLEEKYPNPLTDYHPSTEKQSAIWEIWKALEPNNQRGFYTTFLPLLNQPIKAQELYLFYREVKYDKNIKNPAAVFVKKVKDKLEKIASTSG